jgi:branched-chain amino acid transport system permease protein
MQSASNLLQFLVSGLSTGSIYAIVGLGFMVIYNVTRVVNFAQGEFVMLGGMLTATFLGLHLPLWAAVLLSALATALMGVVMYTSVIYPIRSAPSFALILVSFGASIVIRGIASLVWGTNPKTIPAFPGPEALTLGSVVMEGQVLWVLGITLLLAVGLYLFFERSALGRSFRACSVNPFLAGITGIKIERMGMLAFALAAFLGAIGGAVTGPLTFPSVAIGVSLSVKGFMAAAWTGSKAWFSAALPLA